MTGLELRRALRPDPDPVVLMAREDDLVVRHYREHLQRARRVPSPRPPRRPLRDLVWAAVGVVCFVALIWMGCHG